MRIDRVEVRRARREGVPLWRVLGGRGGRVGGHAIVWPRVERACDLREAWRRP